MPGIFISYRREDTAGHAGRIYDRLREQFGRGTVFMDVAGIEPGVDFVEAIDRAVGSCDALLVIIGNRWLTCTDAAGRRRLEDPHDFIRLETAVALKRGIRVIPVLVQDAAMPTEKDLPDDLKLLARRQATEIGDTHWDSDTEQLVETLAKLLPGEPKPESIKARPAVGVAAPIEGMRDTSGPIPSGVGKNRRIWIISTITAVVVALGGLLYTQTMPEKVTVPDLTGISRDGALVRLGQERLRLGSVKTIPSDRPVGAVIEQDPAPGRQVLPESPVHLVVAEKRPERERMPTPAPEVPVPNLVGQPLEKAHLLLEKAGLKPLSREVRKETREVPEGTVIEQAPNPGIKLVRGKTVELVVAVSPREPEMVIVPDVTDKSVRDAVTMLKDAGLAVESRRTESTRAKPGTVLRQSLKPGSRVRPGETIALTFAVAPQDSRSVQERGEVLPAPTQTWPEDGRTFDNYPRTTALRWEAVRGAASYIVELDCLHCCESGKWCSDLGKPWKVVRDIPVVRSPGYKFQFVGTQTGRWRVWAVDDKGREGEKSPWRTFRYTK